ncbi:MAG: sigma-70 family RNA polymerase sigma factor [Firmicutes bacterium]|nr:sigma-70 family RNA polymerase sigma factor [Bacillota bacterium]
MTTNELINSNMGLIRKIANKFYNTEKEDLIQVGVIGLLKAYQNFKDNGETKFSTYAYTYIFGEMYQLVNSNRNIKISKDLLKIYKMVEKTRYELAQRMKRIPSNEEVALFLELDINMVNDAINSAQVMMSLDDEASELNLHEVIPDKKSINSDLKIDLDDSFKVLNSCEQEIIRSRYYEDLTQSEVARKLNMTQVMVSRYEKKSLEKMRAQLI